MRQLGTTWSEGIAQYAAEHLRLTNKPASRELVLGVLSKFGLFIADKTLDAVTRSDVRQFMVHEIESGLSAWTVNAHLVKLRSFFRWLCVEGALDVNPAEGVPRIPQDTTAKRCVPLESIRTAIEHLAKREDRRLHDLVALAANMGMRLSEMLALTVGDLELDRGRVLVARSKNREPRPVPVNDAAREVLASRRSTTGLLFTTKRGTAYTRENALRDLQAALCVIGLARMTFHGIRHWWITRMYNLYPPEVVRVIAGNSPETARRHYIHSDQFVLPVPPVVR